MILEHSATESEAWRPSGMSEMALSKAEGSNQADGVNAYLVAI